VGMKSVERHSGAWALLTAATWILVGFGGAVRAHGAGLACPDWPLCYGQIAPELDKSIALEWGHRMLAGTIGLGFLAAWVRLGLDPVARRVAGVVPAVAAVLLATQIVLGGLTVLHLLAPWTVSGHLLVGNAFLVTLALITARTWTAGRVPERPATQAQLVVAAHAVVLLALQLRVGSVVSSNGWGLACTVFPECVPGDFLPAGGPGWVHASHRLVAYALIAVWGAASWTTYRGTPAGRFARIGLTVVLVQASLGIAAVLLRLPPAVSLLHTAGAGALTLCTTGLAWDLARRPARVTVEEEAVAK
jgi:cytochrome c oxidase assembly protein subunit 15